MRGYKVDGARLRQLRRRAVLSLRALAEMSGLHANTINDLERNRKRALPGTLQKLAKALGVEASSLVIEDDDEQAA